MQGGSKQSAKPPRPGSSTKGRRRRDALLEAVLRLIETGGLEAVSYRRTAAEAGLPAASITYYFDSVEAMVDEALELFVTRQTQRLATQTRSVIARGDPVEFAEAVVSVLWDQRAGVRAQFALYLASEDRPTLRETAKRAINSYERLAAAALADFGVDDAEALAGTVVALIDGMALRRPMLGREEALRQTTRALLALVGPHLIPAPVEPDERSQP